MHDPEKCPDVHNIMARARTTSQQIACNAEIESFIGVWSGTRKLVPAIPSHPLTPVVSKLCWSKCDGWLCTIIHRVVCLLSSHALSSQGSVHDRWPHVPGLYQLPLYIQSRRVDPRLLVCAIVFSYGCLISVRMEEMNKDRRKQKTRISITEPYYDASE